MLQRDSRTQRILLLFYFFKINVTVTWQARPNVRTKVASKKDENTIFHACARTGIASSGVQPLVHLTD